METRMGRRVFVGSVVAGLPLLAASTSRGAAQSALHTAHAHLDNAVPDPVLEHIVRQLAAAHNNLRRERKGEHARAFASQLRTLAVYGRTVSIDAQVKSGVSTLVERDGRDGVLYTEIDRDRMRAELKRYGAQVDERLLNTPLDLDHARRSAALNLFLASGITPHWDRIATTLERLAPELDRRFSTVVRVQNGFQDPEYWKGYCEELWAHYRETQFLAAALCASAALPIVGAAFVPLCVAHQVAATIYAMVYAGNCLNVN
jgi:hypothetical protein